MGKKTTRFRNFLLVYDEWTTVKFEHCLLFIVDPKREVLVIKCLIVISKYTKLKMSMMMIAYKKQ